MMPGITPIFCDRNNTHILGHCVQAYTQFILVAGVCIHVSGMHIFVLRTKLFNPLTPIVANLHHTTCLVYAFCH